MDEQQVMSAGDQLKQMQVAQRQQEMMQKAQEHVRKVIRGYYSNPTAFSDTETAQIKAMAAEVGIGFEPVPSTKRAIANGVFNALDTAALGLIPDSWGPEKLTTRDEVGSMLGGMLGLAVPGAIGMKAGKLAVGGAEAMAAGKGLNAFKGATQAAAGYLQPEAGVLIKSIAKMQPGKARDVAVSVLEKLYAASQSEAAKNSAQFLLRGKVPYLNMPYLQAGVGLGTAYAANNFFGEE